MATATRRTPSPNTAPSAQGTAPVPSSLGAEPPAPAEVAGACVVLANTSASSDAATVLGAQMVLNTAARIVLASRAPDAPDALKALARSYQTPNPIPVSSDGTIGAVSGTGPSSVTALHSALLLMGIAVGRMTPSAYRSALRPRK